MKTKERDQDAELQDIGRLLTYAQQFFYGEG